jgi:hypothetical protein
MTIYAGLDVSDKATHVCLVDDEGAVIRRDGVASDPDVNRIKVTRAITPELRCLERRIRKETLGDYGIEKLKG